MMDGEKSIIISGLKERDGGTLQQRIEHDLNMCGQIMEELQLESVALTTQRELAR